jgi:hypothetical protein
MAGRIAIAIAVAAGLDGAEPVHRAPRKRPSARLRRPFMMPMASGSL